jgi:RNA polymerase-binding protein DksA
VTAIDTETLQSLRERLLGYRKQLQKEIHDELIREGSGDAVSMAGRVHDAQEESISEMLTQLNISMLSQHQSELKNLERALHMMDTGDYGICIDCDQPIPVARLQANPLAARCIDCQAKHEKN